MAKKKAARRKVARTKAARKATPKAAPLLPTTGLLAQSTTGITNRPYFLIVHGLSGVGKTEWASQAPNCLYVSDAQEGGLSELKSAGKIASSVVESPWVTSWEMLRNINREIVANEDFENVVYDSMTGFEQLCFEYHCEHNFNGNWSQDGFYAYYAGPRNAARTDWMDLMRDFNDIRDSGKNVILIAHSHIKTFKNPGGKDWDRWTPKADDETWAATYRTAQAVFFANWHVEVETTQAKSRKGKAKGGESRFMNTVWDPTYDAKSRWGLPDYIDMYDSGKRGYAAFMRLLER